MKPVAFSKRPEKHAAIREIDAILAGTDYCFLLDYAGLTVSAFAALRAELRKAGATARVVKNRFLSSVARAKGWEGLDGLLKGQTAVIIGRGDPAEVAKTLVAFLKKHERAAVKGAQLDRSLLGPAEVKTLSDLPPKDVLRGMLLGTLLAPATSLVRVLAAPLTSVLYVLTAKSGQAGDGASAA